MGREPKARQTYRGDAVQVNVILRAIELDASCSPDWKAAVNEAGNEFIRLLMLNHREPVSKGESLRKAG
jgi:hypothetical protein